MNATVENLEKLLVHVRDGSCSYSDSHCDLIPIKDLLTSLESLLAERKRLREALEEARKGFNHIGGHLMLRAESDLALYGLKGFAFDRRNEMEEALTPKTEAK